MTQVSQTFCSRAHVFYACLQPYGPVIAVDVRPSPFFYLFRNEASPVVPPSPTESCPISITPETCGMGYCTDPHTKQGSSLARAREKSNVTFCRSRQDERNVTIDNCSRVSPIDPDSRTTIVNPSLGLAESSISVFPAQDASYRLLLRPQKHSLVQVATFWLG
jgi:hypothetical protein